MQQLLAFSIAVAVLVVVVPSPTNGFAPRSSIHIKKKVIDDGSQHPADPDIATSKVGKHHLASTPLTVVQNVENEYWYDAILLNQRDTGGDAGGSNTTKNKYCYRIQMLKSSSTDEYYVWQKWGRMGKSLNGCALKGPFSDEASALPEYSKKYRAKTGNAYDADEFKPKKGKYTLLEINNPETKNRSTKKDRAPKAKRSAAKKNKMTIVKKKPAPPASTTSKPSATVAEAKKKGGGRSHPIDPEIEIYTGVLFSYLFSTLTVVQGENEYWYDAVLNQCNITGGNNNNKYYRIQMLKTSTDAYYVWQKWGRVGEPSTGCVLKGPYSDEASALQEYSKKYRAKTGNAYDADEFKPKKGKYTLLEIDNDVNPDTEQEAAKAKATSMNEDVEYLPSELDAKTKELVEVLFSEDLRNEALTSFNLDLKRLPLGVPSQEQIQKGVDILDKIENKIGGGNERASYQELSSQLYTAIPHSFGRRRPPVINNQESLQKRYDMCNILLDIHSTQETMTEIEKNTPKKKQLPAPVDSHYKSLKAPMEILNKQKKEYKMIKTYFDKTKPSRGNAQLLDVWAVDREGERERFEKFDDLDNRKLLWHGTNIAVAAPIITSGLRIMPHSGGRVGSGIYLASMQEKSAQYTCYYGARFGCMFLTEAALGKMHPVTSDGSHASGLKKAPNGFESVHAVGTTQPQDWKPMSIDGNDVMVPQGEGKASNVQSSFDNDEFLLYDEAQVRLRYVVTVKFN